MHAGARQFVVAQTAKHGLFVSVLEIGSRNVNGGVRDLFPGAVYEGVDIAAGDGVDWVCDAAVTLPAGPYDCVVSCEVFEHEPRWPAIVVNAARVLMPGGRLLLTMAGPGRPPHSALDGGPLQLNEFYGNVRPEELTGVLFDAGLNDVEIDMSNPGDLYASARRGD